MHDLHYLKASASAAGSLIFEDLRIGGFEDIRILYKFNVNVGTLEAVLERPNRRGRVFPGFLFFALQLKGHGLQVLRAEVNLGKA